eukprot:14420222-Alexandrium_andersonii.AAC.1
MREHVEHSQGRTLGAPGRTLGAAPGRTLGAARRRRARALPHAKPPTCTCPNAADRCPKLLA